MLVTVLFWSLLLKLPDELHTLSISIDLLTFKRQPVTVTVHI